MTTARSVHDQYIIDCVKLLLYLYIYIYNIVYIAISVNAA